MEKQVAAQKMQQFQELTQSSIYLMGVSFLLGSLMTLFLLVILDWVRRDKNDTTS